VTSPEELESSTVDPCHPTAGKCPPEGATTQGTVRNSVYQV